MCLIEWERGEWVDGGAQIFFSMYGRYWASWSYSITLCWLQTSITGKELMKIVMICDNVAMPMNSSERVRNSQLCSTAMDMGSTAAAWTKQLHVVEQLFLGIASRLMAHSGWSRRFYYHLNVQIRALIIAGFEGSNLHGDADGTVAIGASLVHVDSRLSLSGECILLNTLILWSYIRKYNLDM